jgi:cardiolipin synthase A/B
MFKLSAGPPLSSMLPSLAELDPVVTTSLWSHLFTVGGVVLAVFALARLLGERRQPGNTVAWLLGIILVPYLAVPLFLLVGGRKIKRLAARKRRLRLPAPPYARASAATLANPTAQTIATNGAGEPVGGNSIRLLTTGDDAYAELERQILAARHTIHIATFILGRDAVGRRVINLLARRAREGVQVRLQLDALGCFFSSRRFADPLREAGGEVVRFLPVLPLSSRGSANLRNHRKIAVFDHHTAIVGGHNIAREYLGPHTWKKRWTDLGAVVTGPAAALLEDVFLADWSFASRQSLEAIQRTIAASGLVSTPPIPLAPPPETVIAGSELQIVASGPDVTGDPLYEGILSMIQEATHNIWLITPYFIPDEVLLRTLIVKARAGRDVTLILPDRSNHPMADYARRTYLRQLVRAGARVLAYEPRMLHAKAIIVDDRLGLIGSANVDMRSLFVNFEIGVLLHSERDVHALRVWAGELVRQTRPISLADLKRRRFPANLAEDISRLFAPLL